MKEKTAGEWMDLYIENGNVCADVVQTVQETLRHPQIVAGEYTVELDDPRVGRMLQVGALPALPPPTRSSLKGPLDGITVIEAAYYYATPFAASLLAELGARVIKI